MARPYCSTRRASRPARIGLTSRRVCSFLALVLVDELKRRLQQRGWELEWEIIRQDLAALMEGRVSGGRSGTCCGPR